MGCIAILEKTLNMGDKCVNRDKLRKGYLVEERPYYTSEFHKLIGVENHPGYFSLDNIGINGENLTIAILSMNRSSLTIRLMNSIAEYLPNFAGEFLIGDNGSEEGEKKILRLHMKKMPYSCRMVEFDKNYGVAGGRNRLFVEVKTDWIMSLDNDLYFTSNPLEQAQKDINALGVQFLVMPLKDKNQENVGIYGANLFVEDLAYRCSVSVGSAFDCTGLEMDQNENGFLCTGLPGGTAILNKSTFFYVGGFDDNMFVGFEDTEFSVRVFQKGFKIGSCGMVSLYHDHPKPSKNHDIDYEKDRFSNRKLFESAMHFEKKAGFGVWNKMVDAWIRDRQKDTGISDTRINGELPKVLLVIDAPNWAFDHIADEIIDNLSSKYMFKRVYMTDVDNLADVFMLGEDCQIIHIFWRGHIVAYWGDYVQNRIKNLGMTEAEFHKKYICGKIISTSVYDHLYLDGPDSEITPELFNAARSIVTNYTVSSKKLWNIYENLRHLRLHPDKIISDGVNLEKFFPINLERFHNMSGRKIKIGWVGNSKWILGDLKGINTIIKPAIEKLQKEGYDIELVLSDRQNGMIPHYRMKDFYAQIDCYVCASLCEGTPNPVLEAMACGVPIISTDVGVVLECFGDQQQQFILQERNFVILMERLRYLLDHKELFAQLSEENLQSIQKWDWKIKVKEFEGWFSHLLV